MRAWMFFCAKHAVDDEIDLVKLRELCPIRQDEPVWQRSRRGELAVVFNSRVVTLLARQSTEHRRGLGFQTTLAIGLRDLIKSLADKTLALVK